MEMCGDAWRCGEMWGDVWRSMEMWGDVGRCGESWSAAASRCYPHTHTHISHMHMHMSQVSLDLCACIAPGEAAQDVEHARHVLGLERDELLVVEEHAGDDLHARADDAAPGGGRSVLREAKGGQGWPREARGGRGGVAWSGWPRETGGLR
eukprot:scaffold79040_cov56-Phaeocystis_antarctica.AAC.1